MPKQEPNVVRIIKNAVKYTQRKFGEEYKNVSIDDIDYGESCNIDLKRNNWLNDYLMPYGFKADFLSCVFFLDKKIEFRDYSANLARRSTAIKRIGRLARRTKRLLDLNEVVYRLSRDPDYDLSQILLTPNPKYLQQPVFPKRSDEVKTYNLRLYRHSLHELSLIAKKTWGDDYDPKKIYIQSTHNTELVSIKPDPAYGERLEKYEKEQKEWETSNIKH